MEASHMVLWVQQRSKDIDEATPDGQRDELVGTARWTYK